MGANNMNRMYWALLAFGLTGLLGCGGNKTQLNTAPLSDEQKAQIKADDQRLDDEESPNNRTRKGKGGR
jgi:hypothetical protein